jgi:hypothetical protein
MIDTARNVLYRTPDVEHFFAVPAGQALAPGEAASVLITG